MKTIVKSILILASLLVSLVFASCSRIGSVTTASLRGNGDLVTKTIPCPEFTSVEAARCVEIRLVDEPAGQISVRADENVMPYVQITCDNKRLMATIDPAVNSISDITVEVVVPKNGQIKVLSASSAGRIDAGDLAAEQRLKVKASSAAKIEGRFAVPELVVDASSAAKVSGGIVGSAVSIDGSSAAKIELEVDAETVEAEASSAAKIELKGRAASCMVSASSSGKVDAGELAVDNADARASSGGKSVVCCSKELKANASSGGKVDNRCRPEQADANASSGGSVHTGR